MTRLSQRASSSLQPFKTHHAVHELRTRRAHGRHCLTCCDDLLQCSAHDAAAATAAAVRAVLWVVHSFVCRRDRVGGLICCVAAEQGQGLAWERLVRGKREACLGRLVVGWGCVGSLLMWPARCWSSVLVSCLRGKGEGGIRVWRSWRGSKSSSKGRCVAFGAGLGAAMAVG